MHSADHPAQHEPGRWLVHKRHHQDGGGDQRRGDGEGADVSDARQQVRGRRKQPATKPAKYQAPDRADRNVGKSLDTRAHRGKRADQPVSHQKNDGREQNRRDAANWDSMT